MAIRGGFRFSVAHELAFPFGLYATGDVAPVPVFVDGKRTERQEIDPVSSLPVWSVPVLDSDPELNAKAKSLTIKVASGARPVLPESTIPGIPFIPVKFVGLTVTPYMENGGRMAYSYRASGMEAAVIPAQSEVQAQVESRRK